MCADGTGVDSPARRRRLTGGGRRKGGEPRSPRARGVPRAAGIRYRDASVPQVSRAQQPRCRYCGDRTRSTHRQHCIARRGVRRHSGPVYRRRNPPGSSGLHCRSARLAWRSAGRRPLIGNHGGPSGPVVRRTTRHLAERDRRRAAPACRGRLLEQSVDGARDRLPNQECDRARGCGTGRRRAADDTGRGVGRAFHGEPAYRQSLGDSDRGDVRIGRSARVRARRAGSLPRRRCDSACARAAPRCQGAFHSLPRRWRNHRSHGARRGYRHAVRFRGARAGGYVPARRHAVRLAAGYRVGARGGRVSSSSVATDHVPLSCASRGRGGRSSRAAFDRRNPGNARSHHAARARCLPSDSAADAGVSRRTVRCRSTFGRCSGRTNIRGHHRGRAQPEVAVALAQRAANH